MTTPITPTSLDDKPGFSATADKLEHLIDILAANVDRYADLLAGTDPFAVIRNQTLQTATIRHLNRQIDDLNSAISEKNMRIFKLTGTAHEVSAHRESVIEMAHYLSVIPRWHWIRRNRIRYQLSLIAISIARRTKA